MFYHHLLVTKPAPPPDPVRGRDVDWAQLTLEEQGCVLGYQRAELPLRAVPSRGQVFIRRYYREDAS